LKKMDNFFLNGECGSIFVPVLVLLYFGGALVK